MKNILKKLSIPVLVTSLLLFTSASSCDQDDPRPSIHSAFPEKWDIPLEQVRLKYDTESFINRVPNSANVILDIYELMAYHNIFISSNDWLDFYDILANSNDSTSINKPSVKFSFYTTAHRDDFKLFFDTFDEDLCYHNIIRNAPRINIPHVVDFSASTIKTSYNCIRIKWEKQYTITGQGPYMTIEEDGTIEAPMIFYNTGTKGGNQLAVRIRQKKMYLIDNTIPPDLPPGEYAPEIVDGDPIISDLFDQDININGSSNNNATWDAPIIVELN